MPFLPDETTLIYSYSDPSKTLRFSLTNITSATDVICDIPNLNIFTTITLPFLELYNTWEGQNTFGGTDGGVSPVFNTGGAFGYTIFFATDIGTAISDSWSYDGAPTGAGLSFPSVGGAVATKAGVQTFTNKRITQRVVTMTNATSFTPAGDTTDIATQANTQALGTLTANAPSGTPTNGQKLIIRIKSTNVQTFAWNAIYRTGTTITLPVTSTGGSKTDYFTFMYNSADSKWDILDAVYGY